MSFGKLVGVIVGVLLALGSSFAQFPPPGSQSPLRDVQITDRSFSRGDPIPKWVDPAPLSEPKAKKPVVVRLADTHFLAGKSPWVFVNRAIQVNESTHLQRIGQFSMQFAPDYQKLRIHSIRIHRAADVIDKTTAASIRFLDRETGLASGIYSGIITAVVLLDDVRVGDVLHLAYSIEGANPVFDGRISDYASWDVSDPVDHRRVTLNFPESMAISWKMIGESERAAIVPDSRTEAGVKRLRFEERSIPGLDLEPYLPPDFVPGRIMQFSEYSNWNAVAKWGEALYNVQAPLPGELDDLLRTLRALPDDDARVSAALQWVQNEIRYFSISLGESSHRPHSPALVVKRRYGDCKDKSLLLISILRALGIPADAAFVSVQSPRGPALGLPTPQAFDHVVVRVRLDGSHYFVDPTRVGQSGAIRHMGQALEGAEALIAASDTQELVRIRTEASVALRRNDLNESIVVGELGGVGTLNASQRLVGLGAEILRLTIAGMDAGQLRRAFTIPYERRYPGITMTADPVIEDDRQRNEIRIDTRFSIPNASVDERNTWIVRFFPRNFQGTFAVPQQVARQFPMSIPGHPYEGRYSVEIQWPESARVIQDPSTRRVDGKYFSSQITKTFRGSRSKIDVVLNTLTDVVPASDVPVLLADLRRMEQLVQGYVYLSKSEVGSENATGDKQSLPQVLRGRFDEIVERVTKTIAGGKLKGTDLAEALCARAEAYADTERFEEGRRDANEAVRIAPSLPRAYGCRGNVYFASGDLQRSVADYTKALTLGETRAMILYRRGHARFYLGNLEQATEDFARASEGSDDESERVYVDLWLMWTLLRRGQPIPQELATRARSQANGDWPRPARAMFAGALKPDEVLQTLDKMKGDEKAMAYAEAWFYVGQHYLLVADRQKAQAAFEESRKLGITMYIEHVAAGYELRKLTAP